MKTIKKALEDILDKGASKYQIAKDLKVQPIMIDNWLTQKVKSMRRSVADRLKSLYETSIDELFINDRKDK